MLLCVNSRKHVVLLENVDVTTVQTDEDLFNKLRTAYNKHRGDPLFRPSIDDRSFMGLLRAVWLNLRLKNVRNPFYRASKMQYIKLQVFPLKDGQDRVGGYIVDSIPSKEEAHRYKYAFSPCPPKFGRFPFPPDHFMHAFLKPGDHFESRYLAAQMLPKKLHQKLSWSDSVNDPDDVPEGWGFLIEEDIDRGFVALLVMVFAALIALVAILWSCFKGDIQGGMGIGGFGIALLAVSVTIFMMVVFGIHC
ncbi:hypothetical protein CKAH01_15537 [Colletotrichum kahawae]|uniref:Uncharacterized protein n=1 Tax=Colletotrichum kahawae TaxID=34407 RepID=A0AAE0D8D7_COLKA|nr:hypothetical protein CKAH01_15537 [Colletotrichum kahawae]